MICIHLIARCVHNASCQAHSISSIGETLKIRKVLGYSRMFGYETLCKSNRKWNPPPPPKKNLGITSSSPTPRGLLSCPTITNSTVTCFFSALRKDEERREKMGKAREMAQEDANTSERSHTIWRGKKESYQRLSHKVVVPRPSVETEEPPPPRKDQFTIT